MGITTSLQVFVVTLEPISSLYVFEKKKSFVNLCSIVYVSFEKSYPCFELGGN